MPRSSARSASVTISASCSRSLPKPCARPRWRTRRSSSCAVKRLRISRRTSATRAPSPTALGGSWSIRRAILSMRLRSVIRPSCVPRRRTTSAGTTRTRSRLTARSSSSRAARPSSRDRRRRAGFRRRRSVRSPQRELSAVRSRREARVELVRTRRTRRHHRARSAATNPVSRGPRPPTSTRPIRSSKAESLLTSRLAYYVLAAWARLRTIAVDRAMV